MNQILLFFQRTTRLRVCVLVMALLTLSLTTQAQTIRYVKPGASGTGTTWANASGDLQAMINASGVQQVWVAAGAYKPGTNRTSGFRMKSRVSIYGGFVGNETDLNQRPTINPVTGQPSSSTLSGEIGSTNTADDNCYNVVSNNSNEGSIDSTAVLDGFVITGGNANGSDNNSGGGMINVRTNPTVRNCSFLSNFAASGGGIRNFNANAILINCFFQGNTASNSGGGIYNDGNSSPRLVNCSFQGNTATGFGGGMHNDQSSPSLTNCTFLANTAITEGGGIYNYNRSNARLINCSFQGNTTSSLGGGMANNASNPSLTNCSFLNNTATTLGGGMYNQINSIPSLTNCSFQANRANGGGGCMFNTSGSNPSLTNCVVFGNGGSSAFDNRGNGAVTLRYSLIEATVTTFTDAGNNIRTIAFPYLSTNSTQLNPCSQAINTGFSSASGVLGINTDLAGSSRVFGGQIDMGAYEFQAAPNLAPTITNPSITTATQGIAFSVNFSASGDASPYEYRVADGALPTGLNLDQTTGALSGTPTKGGSYSIVVEGRDGKSCSGLSNTYTLVVEAVLPKISGLAASSASVCVGTPVTFTATVSNVFGSYDYVLTNGFRSISGTSSTAIFSQTLTAAVDNGWNYTLIVTNNEQTGWAETELTVSQQPKITVYYPASTYCRNDGVRIAPTISSSGIFTSRGTYSSSPAGLSLDPSGIVNTGASSPNAYTISYTYPPTGGCPATTAATALTIIGAPILSLDVTQPNCDVPTGTIRITATSNGTPEFSINNGDTWQTSNVFSGLAPGQTYEIIARSQTEPTCLSRISTSINSLRNTVRISYPAGPYCRNAGDTYPASVTSPGGQGTFTSSPAGLSIDAAGTIIPNESEPGNYTVSYVSSSCTNVTATAAITIVGTLVIGLDVTQPTCATVTGTINVSVTGLSGVEYNINGGPWQPSGLFSGLAAGQLYTVRARLANSPTCESNLTDIPINAVPTPPSVNNPTVNTATIGVAFSQSFTAVGGTGNASFSLANGATLPPGLTLNAVTGVLSGTPTALGSFTLAVRATNANSCSAVSATYTLTVQEPFSPIRYVKQGGAGTGSGSSWANASADLQSQINLAGVTQVWVAAGTYKPGGDANTDRAIGFSMKNDVVIYGGFANTGNPVLAERNPTNFTTVLSGDIGTPNDNSDNSYHVVNNDQTGITSTAILDGFIITGGNASEIGNNSVGGGMINVLTDPIVRNCIFQDNTAFSSGGGMYNYSSGLRLINCSFLRNTTLGNGGGIDNIGSAASLINCSFLSNTAGSGGAMSSETSNPSLTNCSFLNNTAIRNGGAMFNSDGPSLINCSFQGNTANSGGVVYGNTNNSRPNLTNCVLFGNGGANTLMVGGQRLTLRYSLIEASVTGYTNGGNNLTTTVSPFASTTSTQLNGCAAAINTGSNAAYNGPATDLAGNPRRYNNGTVDMGAYEYQANPNPALIVTNPAITTATVGTPFSQTFTASGGVFSYSLSLVNGATLPTGLTLATSGVLSGTPTQTGILSLTVSALDALGCSGTSATYRLTVQDAFSPIRYVKQGGAGTGSGNSWANASADLQSQIDLAGVAQVWVAAGTYKPGGDANTDQSVSFVMKNGVTIYGGFATIGSPTLVERNPTNFTTVLSGDIGTPDDNSDNSYHVINNTALNATAVLDGFVVSGGNAVGFDSFDYGGGMNNEGSSPTLANCLFLNNSAVYGGGISNANASSPTLTNCQFENNSADEGAGMNNGNSSNPSLANCIFRNNSASVGGGLKNESSSPALTNCSFVNNSGITYGGGIVNSNSSPSLTNCLFQDNFGSFYGGGVSNETSNPVLTNCSFQSNSSGFLGGGALYNSDSNPVLTNCSFQANTADNGGAINNQSGNLVLVNCVLFGNGGANAISGAVSASYSLFEASETDYTGANNLTTTVSPFASATSTQLNGCAPAINTGNPTAYNGPATDLAGSTRVFGGTIDMGAYEYQAAPNPDLIVTNPTVTTATQGSPVSVSFVASGGTAPYSFSLDSSSLPASLSLSATGVLSGTPTQSGSYSITVRAIDANGCSGVSATYTLVINDATPTITGFAANPNSVCIGSPVTFTATIGNFSGNYGWSLSNGGPPIGASGPVTSSTLSVTLTANGSGLQTYTLTVTNNGQSSQATASVMVNSLPTIDLSAANVCVGQVLDLSATNGLTSYTFTGPTGVIAGSGNTRSVESLSAGTYSFSVAGANANGCVNTDVVSVTVNASPIATLVSSGSLTCSVTSVTLTASGGDTYRFAGPGVVSQSANQAVVNTSGIYSVTVTNTATGCFSATSITIDGGTATVVVSNPSTSTATVGQDFSQNFTAQGGSGTYRFSIVSSNLPTSLSLSNDGTLRGTPTTAGSYSVLVNAQDQNGCVGVASTAYTLIVSTTASVTTAAASNIQGTSATLGGNVTADGGTPVTERGVVYLIGSGTPTTSDTKVAMGVGTGSFSQPVVGLSSSTTYSVRAYAINAAGTSYGELQTFTTATAPSAPVVVTPANGSQQNDNTPTYSGTSAPTSSLTVLVDGNSVGETLADANGNWSLTPSVALAEGSHTVNARAELAGLESPLSNTNTFFVDTTPPGAPVVTSPANGATIGDNLPTYLGTAEPSSTVTVIVDGSAIGTTTATGGGNWSLTQGNPLAPGSHTVKARASDGVGNTSVDSNTNTFVIDNTQPTVSVTSSATSPTSTSPIPVTITFSKPVTGFVVSEISVSNGTISEFAGSGTTYTVTVTPVTSGLVSVSVLANVAQDQASNFNQASNVLGILYAPAPTLAGFGASPDAVCVGSPVTFTANVGNVTGNYNYTLTNGGSSPLTGMTSGAVFSQIVTANGSDVQTFTLTVTFNGETVRSTADLTVNSLPSPGLTNSGPLSCTNTSVTLTATGGSSFTFTNSSGEELPGSGNIRTVSAAGTYSVRVANASGCVSTTTTSVDQDNTAPVASLVSSGSLTCSVTSVTLTASPSGQHYMFSGPGILSQNGNTVVVNAGGTYSVTVSNPITGCSSTTTTTVASTTAVVTVSAPATTTANLGQGFNQTFTARDGVPAYSFSLASGSLPSGLSLTQDGVLSGTPTESGSFAITVRATDANGCSGVSATYTLLINDPIPTLAGFGASPNPVCVGNPVSFTASVGNVTGSYNYTLANGQGISLTGSASGAVFSLQVRAAGTGSQSFTLTVEQSGQRAVAQTSLNLSTAQALSLSNSGPVSFTNASVTLTASPGFTSYVFSPGASQPGGPASNKAQVSGVGVYSVTATTSEGCSATASTTVTGGNNPTVCRGGTAVISVAVSGNPVRYEWYKNSLTTPKIMETPQLFRGTATSSLTIINAQTNTQGDFYLKTTDGAGTVTIYGPYRLTVDASCRAREAAPSELTLQVDLAPNPLQQERLRAVIRGAEGSSLQVELVDLRGRLVRQQRWSAAAAEQVIDWDLQGEVGGVYVLGVISRSSVDGGVEHRSVKVIKP
ncbi:hypothetical protein GCM10027341_08410 [Spirosoma knui]